MSSIDRHTDPPVPTPEALARNLADRMRSSEAFDPDEVDAVRSSDAPLEEPFMTFCGEPISIGSIVRWHILYDLETREDVFDISHWRTLSDRQFSFYTHPSLLGAFANRLVVPPVLAKAYQYGFEPSYLVLLEGAGYEDRAEFEANSCWEFRQVTLKKWSAPDPDPMVDDPLNDAAAVAAFADRVAADDVAWERYLPWYRSITVPTYRVETAARTLASVDRPPLPPADRVTIRDRFEPGPDPEVGDFIRTAILRALEREFTSIVAVDTGPGAWSTDRVTLVVRPTGELIPGETTEQFVPADALLTLNRLGYRPIDGWYGHAAVGHAAADPISPRTVEFARGAALREWIDETLPAGQVFADASVLTEEWFWADLDWQEVVRCARTVTMTANELDAYAPDSDR